MTSDKGDLVSDKIESHKKNGSKAAKNDEKFVKKDLQGICSTLYCLCGQPIDLIL